MSFVATTSNGFFLNVGKIICLIFLCAGVLLAKGSKRKNTAYKSQFGQDQYVNEHFFHNKQAGIFLDIGAHDGITLSNTYFFEHELGWKGICVEPLPSVFNQLQKNRTCICLQGCVSNFSGKAKFAEVISPNVETQMLSGLAIKYDPRHMNLIQSKGGQIKYFEVDCVTPQTIFEKFNVSHIDFLSIDTEGGEFDILSLIDLKKIDIDVITIEVNYHEDKRIYNYLTAHNYQFVQRLGCDELYKKIR
ncbi:MAG: FkbM family methyltransferase [Candidatus Babeliales bacterium]